MATASADSSARDGYGPKQAREGERAHHDETKRSDQFPAQLPLGEGQIEDASIGAEPGFEGEPDPGCHGNESAENDSAQSHEFQIREPFDGFGHGRFEDFASSLGARVQIRRTTENANASDRCVR